MNKDTSGFPGGSQEGDRVIVYLQMSYQLGGYCLIVPSDHIRTLDMSVEDGLRWVLTAGVSGFKDNTA